MPDISVFKVGLVGFGIGKNYSAALRSAPLYYPDLAPVELVGIATSHPERAEQAIKRMGFVFGTTDYHELLNRSDINTIVLAVPNADHFGMLQDALPSDKAILTDKPLTRTLMEANQLLQQARRLGRDAQVMFEMRYSPALQHARQVIGEGKLGEIYAVRGEYFRSSYSDPQKPLRWKASARHGGGALNDLGSHLIDVVGWLVGLPVRVNAQLRTFVPLRPAQVGDSTLAPVETDDHCLLQLEFVNGAIGSIETGRLITGAINDASLAIYGSRGSLRWNLMDGNYLYLTGNNPASGEAVWQKLPTVQRYPGADLPGADYPTGMMRTIIACCADFLRRSAAGQSYNPGLLAGANVQAVLEAAEGSTEQGKWVQINYPAPGNPGG
jgi:predicted dehydrogenase